MKFFENMNEDYYPIDALNKGQFTSLKGALDPFHGESPVSYLVDFQEFCTVVHLDRKDFLKTDIKLRLINNFFRFIQIFLENKGSLPEVYGIFGSEKHLDQVQLRYYNKCKI